MPIYHNEIKRIKSKGTVNFIQINHLGQTITLKLVDDSDETSYLLTEWRKKYHNMFKSFFKISEKRTKNWIKENILKNPDRILFVIYLNETKVGTIGTAFYDEKINSAQIDNLMKSPSCNYPPLIPLVEQIYLKWMFDSLKLSKIHGLLFRDNFPTMILHKSCGFKVIETFPIKKIFSKDGWTWEKTDPKSETKPVERYFNVIEILKDDLIKNMDEIDFKIFF